MASPKKRRMRNILRWEQQERGELPLEVIAVRDRLFGIIKKEAREDELAKRKEEDKEAEQGIEFELKIGDDEPAPKVDEKLLEELLSKKELEPELPKKRVVKKVAKKKLAIKQLNSLKADGTKKTRKELRAEIIAKKLAERQAKKDEE